MINDYQAQRKEKDQKKDNDYWGIGAALGRLKKYDQNISDYSPYYDKNVDFFILAAEFTEKNCVLLLKNGIVLMLKEEENLNKNISEAFRCPLIPIHVKCRIKLVDISCGKKHTLAKGINYKVFSWGFNTHGQLGTPKFDENTEITEPYMVTDVIENSQVIHIYARGYTSYVITEGKEETTLYGFGNNDRFQICSYPLHKPEFYTFKTPQLMLAVKNRNSTIHIKKRNEPVIIAEVYRPVITIDEGLDIPVKRELCNEETKLTKTIKDLQKNITQYRRVRTTVDDFAALHHDIQTLIGKLKEKANHHNQDKKVVRYETNPVKPYVNQMIFLQNLKEIMRTQLKEIDLCQLDDRIQSRASNEFEQNSPRIEESKEDRKLEEKHLKEDVLGIPDLIDIVHTELNVQKFRVLENYHIADVAESKIYKKGKKYQNDMKLFLDVQDIINKRIEKILDKNTSEETEKVNLQLLQEYPSFKNSLLKESFGYNEGLTVMQQNPIERNLKVSTEQLLNLGEKITNWHIQSKNTQLGKVALSMFNKNIELARQNNNMMSLILNLSHEVYQSSFDKVTSYANPAEFLKIKNVVDEIKKKEVNLEEIQNEYDDNTITELHSEDERNL